MNFDAIQLKVKSQVCLRFDAFQVHGFLHEKITVEFYALFLF